MKSIILLFFISLIMISCGAIDKNEHDSNKKKVFLFAGQSNMDGRGKGDELSKNDLDRLAKVAGRIEFYYNHQPVTPLQLTNPGKFVQNKFNLTQSFGSELFFGIELAEKHPKDEFFFIKRSAGGTSLHGCWNPDWSFEKAKLMNEQDSPKLYSEFIAYIQSILQSYNSDEYEIKGMLWVQGEADSNVKNYGEMPAVSYGQNLKNLIKATRIDLDTPQMPFIAFQLGSGKVIKGMINTAEKDENVYLIPQSHNQETADFYEQNPPATYHYTTKSMKKIGIVFLKHIWKRLINNHYFHITSNHR